MKDTTKQIIFPFTFKRLPSQRMLLANQAGEFIFIPLEDLTLLINGELSSKNRTFLDLKSKHFVTDTETETPIDLLATKLRTRKGFLKNFTALHMIVVTARCNFRCDYCHASSASPDQKNCDMSWDTAQKVVDLIFCSPSPTIKIEFQGGEPLLNWPIVKRIVEYARSRNRHEGRNLEFVICTNLTLIEGSILKFLKRNNVMISTSLDGPKPFHESHRISRDGTGGFDLFKEKLALTRSSLGQHSVSALLTVTKTNLRNLRQVVEEYLASEFNGIFIRPLNPYGRAKTGWQNLSYSTDDFLEAYKDVLQYIIQLNLSGTRFVEYYIALMLSHILTPFSTGFMDLQSPTGAGISGAIYDYDGNVFPSDECRMLARSGDQKFRMGNVHKQSYEDIFNGDTIRSIIRNSCVETLPGCATCVFQLYCGADPIRNYVESGDIAGHRPTSDFCKKNMGIMDFLFDLLDKNDPNVMDVFWSWITNRSLEEIRV